MNTGKRIDLQVSRTKNPLCMGDSNFLVFCFVLFIFSSSGRGKRSHEFQVQDDDQCFLLSGLSMLVSKTDLLT